MQFVPSYGNSETDDSDDGCGAMEAIYLGNAHWHGNSGAGKEGPWAGADLEQGMSAPIPDQFWILPRSPDRFRASAHATLPRSTDMPLGRLCVRVVGGGSVVWAPSGLWD